MTEPPQTAERRQTIDDALARLPRVDIAWHTPAALAPDDDALKVLATRAVERPQLALLREHRAAAAAELAASAPRRPTRRGPGLFQVVAPALPGKTIADLEQAIYAEIEKVKTGPIADWEIEKARNSQKRSSSPAWAARCSGPICLGQYALFCERSRI